MPAPFRPWPNSASANAASRPPMRGWQAVLAHPAAGGAGHGWPVAGGSWLAGPAAPPTSQSPAPQRSVDRSEAPMSKRTRALILASMVAALNLAGMTAVAHAQANDEHAR